jgi:hypothetical protein
MTSSPSRCPQSSSSFRLAVPQTSNSVYASLGISPRRRTLRPSISEEGVRHFEDVPLPLWSVSPRRTLSPANRGHKNTLELRASLSDFAAPISPGVGSNVSFSSPLFPSAAGGGGAGALVQLPPAAFEDPHVWEREYVQLRAKFLRPGDAVTIYHDYTSPLNSRATMRRACVVRPLPNLEKVQEALRCRCGSQKSASAYDVFEQQCSAYSVGTFNPITDSSCSAMDDTVSVTLQESVAAVRGAHRDQRNDTFLPAAQTWCVGGSTYDNEIVVCSGATGQRLMRVLDPKMRVAVTALQHAPLRGFMETQQLHVLPVRDPQGVLRLKAPQLVFTDYVWCGFQDGTLRLVPASHQYIRASGPSPPFSKSPSANLVYELPRYQGGAIVSIVCSPCHDEEEAAVADGDGLAESHFTRLPNRVSAAVRCMTAAAACADSADTSRQHLSLVCTASTDATIIVWDMRKVYEAVAQAKQRSQEAGKRELPQRGHGYGSSGLSASMPSRHGSLGGSVGSHGLSAAAAAGSTAAMVCNDVITFDCSSPIVGLQNITVRSSCTMIQVRPLAKLSGGFAGLTALRWVSSLISTGAQGVAAHERDVRCSTRIPQIAPCPQSRLPSRELAQMQTRFDKREAERAELELTEEEMQGMEKELAHMLPPLAIEPPQSLRVNLLVAADCMGTVHLWNLDEELHRHGGNDTGATALGWPADFGASARSSVCSVSPRSDETRSSVSYVVELKEAESTPTRQNSKRKTANGVGVVSSRGSGGGLRKKTARSSRSRRSLGKLGLAEARESRSRLSSELSAARISTSTSALDWSVASDSLGRRGSPQRPSLGRSSCEVAAVLSSPRKSHLLRSRKDTNITLSPSKSVNTTDPSTTTTPTKKGKKMQSSLLEGSLFTSPSRGSQQRPSTSPGRQGENQPHLATQSTSARHRTSVQRGPSISLGSSSLGSVQDMALSAQPSRCQICLASGLAITDMVVDLPKLICTTLRRIRHPSHATASWQHRPTEEEMDNRALENEFEELTEEKALFFAFQKLELYVGVDGSAVSSVRCAPAWMLPDHDGRELFKLRGDAVAAPWSPTVTAVAEWMTEVRMPEVVSMGAFQLHLHRRLLDVHEQPITHLFLDPWQRHLWVSRQDGFVSVLSTQDKQIVSRIAHPSADALLPPPPPQEWAKLQTQSIARCAEESRGRSAAAAAAVADPTGILSSGPECHKECKGLPPNHLTEVLPIGVRRQRALVVFITSAETNETALEATTDGHHPCFATKRSCYQDVSSPLKIQPAAPSSIAAISAGLCSSPPTNGRLAQANASVASSSAGCCGADTSFAAVVCLDGEGDVKSEFRSREAHRWRWLQELQQCRLDSFAACQAQRHLYYAFCNGIGRNVRHVIGELGDYAVLSQLRACFHAWKNHRVLFRHTYIMRRQRTARLQRERPLVHQLEAACQTYLCGVFFVRWMQLVVERRRNKQDTALHCFASAAVSISTSCGDVQSQLRRHRRPLPTTAMMDRLFFLSAALSYFRRWWSWAMEGAEQRRQHQQQQRHHKEPEGDCLHRQSTPQLQLKRSASTPMATPSRHVGGGDSPRGVDGGFSSMRDIITPYRPIHSTGGYGVGHAEANTWTARRRMAEEEVLTPSHLRVDGPALSLPASVEPFMAEMAELLRARVYVFHFSDARSSTTSVLDESWTVILENAESGADGDGDDERRFSVFRFALLPLLQGLLSTADDVLPSLFDNSVAEEVLSMLVGIVLAVDYVTANAECMPWLTEAATSGVCHLEEEVTQPLSAFDAALAVLRVYAVRAFRTDAEAAEVLRGLAKSKTVLGQFLDFAMERAVARRMARF